MFLLTVIVYPLVLALLCAGAGVLVDRASGGALCGPLLVPVGAAALIALSQLTTYIPGLARATPAALAIVALAGVGLAWQRARRARAGLRESATRLLAAGGWVAAASVLVYVIALAPVLLSGRATFSSFMALSDSAFHLIGADYLIRHGQSYSHLDLRNSYGLFIDNYYNSSYPSGADTLFGGSAFLLGLPLIWAFQPFIAFMLAAAAGPAWLLARGIGLDRAWAAVATLCATLPALVYAYALIGSVKEIAALALILCLGALVTVRSDWLHGSARGAIPFALVTAAGVSALGVGFGAWALAAALVALVVLVGGDERARAGARLRRGAIVRRRDTRSALTARPLVLVAVGLVVLAVSALPTWADLSGSVQVTQSIAGTSNPGNLRSPLKAVQALGVWLDGSYKLAPGGGAHTLTYALIALALAACVLGVVQLLRSGPRALACWLVLMAGVWLIVSSSSTTWVGAKTLMLTSPAVVLAAWAGVAALRASRWSLAAGLVGALLLGGVLVSDAFQYRSSDLAPTARYEELASLNARFAGRGPTLFTDFDEYAMYELRDLDIGGPDFVYPPPALAQIAGGYGRPVNLQRALPAALSAYPLIITRRNPAAVRPPAAYRLAWQGTYYQVWQRQPSAPPALAHVALTGGPAAQCAQIARVAASPAARGAQLVAATAPTVVRIPPQRAAHPRGWGRVHGSLVLSRPGSLSATFVTPRAGDWTVWLEGRLMPAVTVDVDGRRLGTIAGQLAGNSLVPDTMTPLRVRLAAGAHRLTITRGGFTLAPGGGGTAVLDGVLVAPAGASPVLRAVAGARWRSLCGVAYQWVELVGA
ncbi:MAG TPA: hypothetical protein VEJ23_10380 [Solirubrobacteraceae bacterium]|nr:hypothetical protein [Solirubrobacteraceae bacterium]